MTGVQPGEASPPSQQPQDNIQSFPLCLLSSRGARDRVPASCRRTKGPPPAVAYWLKAKFHFTLNQRKINFRLKAGRCFDSLKRKPPEKGEPPVLDWSTAPTGERMGRRAIFRSCGLLSAFWGKSPNGCAADRAAVRRCWEAHCGHLPGRPAPCGGRYRWAVVW